MPVEVTRSSASVVKSGTFEVGQGPVRMRVTKTGPNENTIELRVEYDQAEVPSRAYVADYTDVILGRSGVSLIFGKLKPGTSNLRNKVEIVFPVDLFLQQLWKSSRKLHEKVAEHAKQRPAQDVSEITDTEMVQAFRANNAMMICAGDEGLMDFYHIAPSDVNYAFRKKKNEIPLDPVIRIVLSTTVVFEFLEKCKTVVEQIPGFELIMGME